MQTKTQQHERLFWPDAAKAICMLLINYMHIRMYYNIPDNIFNNTFTSLYGPFFVNAFFVITGYFFFNKQLNTPIVNETFTQYYKESGKKQVLNVMFRILIPSLLFSILTFVPKVILKSGSFDLDFFLNKTILGGSYWFTSALISAYIIILIPIFLRIKNIGFYIIYAIICAFLGNYLLPYKLPWEFAPGLVATLFIVSGGVIGKYSHIIFKYLKWPVILALIIIYTILTVVLDINITTETYNESFNINGYLVSLLGSIILIAICQKLPYCKFLAFIGKNSILFYFLCGAIPYTIIKFVNIIAILR